MVFKFVIGDAKSKRTFKAESDKTALFTGKKIGEKVQGDLLNLPGYEMEITGGSDKTGTPMRSDAEGSAARRLLLVESVGFRGGKKGIRQKKRVRGNTISADTVQVNLKVTKYGEKSLAEIFPEQAKPKEKKEGEAAPAEAAKEEKK